MHTTPTNKELSTKMTTTARVTTTSGPAVAVAKIRKNKKRRAAASETLTEALQGDALPTSQAPTNGNIPTELTTTTLNGTTAHAPKNRITLPPVPLLSFFEESIDVFPVSPSPNADISQSQMDLLAALRDGAITSTPCVNPHDTTPLTPDGADPNQSFSTPAKSLKDRLLEAEERGGPLGNIQSHIRTPLDKYTKGLMPPIHYAHPTAILDHLDVNLVGDWESLPKGKLLAQPFGPDARSVDKHSQLKALLFAAVVEITGSRDTPYSFLIYNITEEQAQTLLQRKVWFSTAISFSVSTFNPPCPAYLFTLKGLTTMDDTQVSNMVKKNSLKVDRLDVKLRGNTIAPNFNIYANGSLI
ncbi:hypothetical protein BGY98DRAFT_935770, partial [Russula aff. rugulosa BPL654]